MRQLTLNVVDIIKPKPRLGPFHSGMSKNRGSKSAYCAMGGAGPGFDFKKCGWPGNVTFRDYFAPQEGDTKKRGGRAAPPRADVFITYAAKGYVDSEALDIAYASWAAAKNVDAVVIDVGRWSGRPGTPPDESAYLAKSVGLRDPFDAQLFQCVSRFMALVKASSRSTAFRLSVLSQAYFCSHFFLFVRSVAPTQILSLFFHIPCVQREEVQERPPCFGLGWSTSERALSELAPSELWAES